MLLFVSDLDSGRKVQSGDSRWEFVAPVSTCHVEGKMIGHVQRTHKNSKTQEEIGKALTMDYEGQKLAELLFYIIICLFGAVGWVIGYIQQDFTVVFQAWLVGVILSVIVCSSSLNDCCCTFHSDPVDVFQLCVPDWPFYNRHPIQWLESVPTRQAASKND